MYQQERMNEIIRILKSTHYATVDYLVERIRHSPASIRRDLTLLEKQGLVKRSHGGVEINQENATPFKFRQHSMKAEKNKIAQYASTLIKDGDIMFFSTTATITHMLETFLSYGIDTMMAPFRLVPTIVKAVKETEQKLGKKIYMVDTPNVNVENTPEGRQARLQSRNSPAANQDVLVKK